MSTAITHGFVAIMFGKLWTGKKMSLKFWTLSVICSILPDIDSLGYFLVVQYSSVIGHRGLFHSIPFAFVVSLLVVSFGFSELERLSKTWLVFIFFFIVTASHGFLDAMTDGGLGIAFFSPFDESRFFLPWRPLKAPFLNLAKLGSTIFCVMIREIVFIWIPMMVLIFLLRYKKQPVRVNKN